jgi:uncharacterized protein YjiS (DUF1127 family)
MHLRLMQRPETAADLSTVRAFRSPALGPIVIAAMREANAIARQAFARYRKRRQMKASYAALRRLDDRTLRDLGFHRSEIMPVTAEIAGEAEYTRMRYWHELLR